MWRLIMTNAREMATATLDIMTLLPRCYVGFSYKLSKEQAVWPGGRIMSLISLPSPYKESDITQPPELRPACDLIWEEERGTHCRSCFHTLTRTPIIFLRVVGLSSVYCSPLVTDPAQQRRVVARARCTRRPTAELQITASCSQRMLVMLDQ